MGIPEKLKEMVAYLKDCKIGLSSYSDDGRVNSSFNEDEILNILVKKFDIEVPRSRAWFDFSFKHKKEFYPVNIKITNTMSADNLNCKLGIYYALTGLIPDFANEINWKSYFEKLKENLGISESDYYFLVFNKEDNGDIFANSLKGLSALQPSGNNLPFQCKWDSNREYIDRTFDESKQFILTVFGQSIKLRSEIYFNFKQSFPEYV